MIILNATGYSPSTNMAMDTFSEISQWISANNGIGFFNHSGRQNASGEEFSHFTDMPNLNIVGMELWNKSAGFSTYYYNDGYYPNDGTLGYYDEANTRRWKIGASGSEDNHTANWGNASDSRLAVLAKANTRPDLLDAMRKRHFYSTLDKKLALSFTLDSAQMGDSVKAGRLRMSIECFDADNENFSKVTLKKNGITYKSWEVNTQHPIISDTITCAAGEYLYAVVAQADGNEAISSPIYVAPYNPIIIRDSMRVRNVVIIKKIIVNLYTIIRSDTIINIDTVVQKKTVIMNDTVYNTDTLVSTDTTFANSSMRITDTLIFRDTLYFRDTMRISDTIKIADTLYITRTSSIKQQVAEAYPNPFSDYVTVRNSDKLPVTVILCSIQGNMLIKQRSDDEQITIETAHNRPGAYILTILYPDTSESFIINKEE